MNDNDNEILWRQALEIVKAQVPESEFLMWFRLAYLGFEKGTLSLRASNTFLRDQFLRKYGKLMKEVVSELLGMPVELSVEAQSIPFLAQKRVQQSEEEANSKSSRTASAPSDAQASTMVLFSPSTHSPAPRQSNLQPRYTFESFVVGENNNFAYNAASAVSEHPGTSYNPLLIYGGVGLGKTHLMHAIGNRITEKHSEMSLICVTAEDFTNEFIKTIHDRTTNEFKNKYRNIDVLLIDDIHFFQSKHGVQEELFHTFNALYDTNKQLIFTCDRPASELKDFSERLKSRFMMGLKTDLTTPGFETRAAIIRKKLDLLHRGFSEDIISLIAKSIETNVRDLDSCINQVVAYSDLIKVEPTFEIAQNIIKQLTNSFRPQAIDVSSIIKTVADYYKLSISDLKGKKRSKNIALARQVAMYIVRETTDYSTTEIGAEFNGRDHTTVMHSCQKIEDMVKFDSVFSSIINRLTQQCKETST